MLTAALPLAETVAALRSGALDLRSHVNDICDRIESVEPRILALLPEPGRRQRLLREAAALERRYPRPERRPALYGCLVGVKDVFQVEGFPTRAGSALPPELFAGREAACVRRLRRAGVLILGKTATAEFAFMEPAATRNPHAPEHTPGGSSSGSAAAVAAGFVALALGTQTAGSTIRPAAYCGEVGFKPSFERIPTAGLVYAAPSLDHVGLFSQDATGMRLAASVLVDGWRSDARAKRRPVIGVAEGPYLRQASGPALRAFERQLARLESAGFEVRRVPALEDIEGVAERHRWLMASEFAEQHDAWYREYGALYRPGSASFIELGRSVTRQQRSEARRSPLGLRRRLHGLMRSHRIDLWASPAAIGPPPRGQGRTGDPAMNVPWTHAGLPTITLPAGSVRGLPVGLQLAARFGADEELLAWAEVVADVVAGR